LHDRRLLASATRLHIDGRKRFARETLDTFRSNYSKRGALA